MSSVAISETQQVQPIYTLYNMRVCGTLLIVVLELYDTSVCKIYKHLNTSINAAASQQYWMEPYEQLWTQKIKSKNFFLNIEREL